MRHLLLAMDARTSSATGEVVPLAGRSRLTLECLVGALAGTCTVVLEASPLEDGVYTELVSIAVVAPGLTTKATTTEPADFTLQPWHRFVRARLTDVTDTVTVEVTLVARFFEPAAAEALKATLPKELRTFSELARLAEEAEADVLALLRTAEGDALDLDLTAFGVGETLVMECTEQLLHLWRRHQLAADGTPGAHVTLRALGDHAPNLGKRLNRFRPVASTVWRGR